MDERLSFAGWGSDAGFAALCNAGKVLSSGARERHFLVTAVAARLAPLCKGSSGKNGALRSLWAVADQGVVSGFSFAFNLLLARTLPESDFGIAVLVIGGLYMLHSVHRSLVLYPFSL